MEQAGFRDHEEQINEWRHEIDEVDTQLFELINRRTQIALEIGAIKAAHNLPVFVPAREEIVLKQVEEKSEESAVAPEDMRAIFAAIMKASRSAQHVLQSKRE